MTHDSLIVPEGNQLEDHIGFLLAAAMSLETDKDLRKKRLMRHE